MPMDGLTVRAQVRELNTLIKGARVDKINQPEEDEIILNLFLRGENFKLLLCSNASFPRVNITKVQKSNPAVPPAFCMLLRKHLSGSHILSFSQPGNERIINITFQALNDFNEPEEKTLTVEIMGKYSNIIFVGSDGRILDSIRRVNSLMSRMRCVQPGLEYVLPPSQGKLDPFSETVLPENASARFIADAFTGISRQSAEEIVYRNSGDINAAFRQYVNAFDHSALSPVLLLDDSGSPIDFFAFPQKRFLEERQKKVPALSTAIDEFYLLRDKSQRLRERSRDIKMRLQTLLEKAEKKRAMQIEKYDECKDMEKYRIWGELITANIYKIRRGDKTADVLNYYTNETESVPLDVRLSPGSNAQKYFKTYNKLKTAQKLLSGQIEENEKEIDMLTAMLENLELSETDGDIADIARELAEAGLVRKKGKKEKIVESRPMHFVSSEGVDIFVGKNNLQNDKLTMHFASSDDLWLHVKDIHGSHVIIHGGNYGNETVSQAAMLAVYYSKGRASALVPVDAVKRRYIKKPAGSAPGKVIYTNQTTYYITVDESEMKKIKKV